LQDAYLCDGDAVGGRRDRVLDGEEERCRSEQQLLPGRGMWSGRDRLPRTRVLPSSAVEYRPAPEEVTENRDARMVTDASLTDLMRAARLGREHLFRKVDGHGKSDSRRCSRAGIQQDGRALPASRQGTATRPSRPALNQSQTIGWRRNYSNAVFTTGSNRPSS
jgi:hypothetical protein